jgi:magnesium-transporting ATPase (P-type)
MYSVSAFVFLLVSVLSPACYQFGIVVQSVVTTIVVLFAYYQGLVWFSPANIYTRDEHLLIQARTMAFVTLSLAELVRAYTVRHNRLSIFSIGFFTNFWMQFAVFGSAALVILVADPSTFYLPPAVCVKVRQTSFSAHD